MRLRTPLAFVSIGLLGGALAVQACSASDVTADDVVDAATGEGGRREAASDDAADRDPPCNRAADLFARVHDASIGDGSSTTGLCLGCARKECGAAIANCTEDCPCQEIVRNALECYLTTQMIGCASELANIFVTKETRKDALSLLGCVQSTCPVECAVDAGPDAEPSSDAAADGD
ncbi:MAG: hypothetical protein JWP87_4135 [Labilithrix sp.]|nr:hypothetical protein [Labilithrix sp.]